MANDKNIRLGQLFALDDKVEGTLLLQYVYDIGDWWSHSICVTKFDETDDLDVPNDATVAHLLGGEGGSIPEDSGGIHRYFELILKLNGQMVLDPDEHNGKRSNINPSCEEWWSIFNSNFRQASNRCNFLSNPMNFNIEKARAKLKTEICRPRPKEANCNERKCTQSGLAYDMGKKCTTIELSKKPTDVCAYCGVTVALKRCSGKLSAIILQ